MLKTGEEEKREGGASALGVDRRDAWSARARARLYMHVYTPFSFSFSLREYPVVSVHIRLLRTHDELYERA